MVERKAQKPIHTVDKLFNTMEEYDHERTEEDDVHRSDKASAEKVDREPPSKASVATTAHAGDDRPNRSRRRG